MITAAAHNLSFASPLGTIESKLRPFFHLSDASCLGLRGLGQVDASYGFTYAVVGLGGDSLCCNRTSKPSLTSTRRGIPSTSVGAVPAVLSTSCVRPKTASVTALVTHGK